jgi:hypothetical protein
VHEEKASRKTQGKEHKASNAAGITKNAGSVVVFHIPQVFAFVFFFVSFVTISPCVLRVKILICQRHTCSLSVVFFIVHGMINPGGIACL